MYIDATLWIDHQSEVADNADTRLRNQLQQNSFLLNYFQVDNYGQCEFGIDESIQGNIVSSILSMGFYYKLGFLIKNLIYFPFGINFSIIILFGKNFWSLTLKTSGFIHQFKLENNYTIQVIKWTLIIIKLLQSYLLSENYSHDIRTEKYVSHVQQIYCRMDFHIWGHIITLWRYFSK